MVEVLLYSKPGCHLCGDVKEQLQKLQLQCLFQSTTTKLLTTR